MEIVIKGEQKEIAALILAIQEQQKEKNVQTDTKRKKKLTAKEKRRPEEKEVLAYKNGRPYFKKI